MKKIAFIYNPVSGRKNLDFKAIISSLSTQEFEVSVVQTEYPKHAKIIAEDAARSGAEIVVAVGGDGTVNEVASALSGTGTALGIIPTGSGNGLARSLKIPMEIREAISVIFNGKIKKADTISINDKLSVNMSGTGFDAHIAHCFANSKTRGFISYLKIIFAEFFSYKPEIFKINANGNVINTTAFLISIANSNQWGNKAKISPGSLVDDGTIEMIILKPFLIFQIPALVYRLFNGTINKSKQVIQFKSNEFIIQNSKSLKFHTDGEPCVFEGDIAIKVNPGALNVIVP